jgi:hypothetical protein
VFDWANWGIAAGIVLLCGIVVRFIHRCSINPGRVTLTLTAALMIAAIPISRHQEPPEPTTLAHFWP